MSSDATAVLTGKQRAGKSKGWTKAAIIWISLSVLFVLMILGLVFWIVGITHGREFNAANWTFRQYTFFRNPLTGGQLSGIHHKSDFTVPASIAAHIGGGPLAPSSRWDLVEIYKGPAYCRGQAQVLLDYLSALDQQNNFFWEAWSNEHPKAAPVLWSAVRDCVHLPRYDRLPELFDIARTTTDPVALKTQLNDIMAAIAADEAKFQASVSNAEAVKRAEQLMAVYGSDQ